MVKFTLKIFSFIFILISLLFFVALKADAYVSCPAIDKVYRLNKEPKGKRIIVTSDKEPIIMLILPGREARYDSIVNLVEPEQITRLYYTWDPSE